MIRVYWAKLSVIQQQLYINKSLITSYHIFAISRQTRIFIGR